METHPADRLAGAIACAALHLAILPLTGLAPGAPWLPPVLAWSLLAIPVGGWAIASGARALPNAVAHLGILVGSVELAMPFVLVGLWIDPGYLPVAAVLVGPVLVALAWRDRDARTKTALFWCALYSFAIPAAWLFDRVQPVVGFLFFLLVLTAPGFGMWAFGLGLVRVVAAARRSEADHAAIVLLLLGGLIAALCVAGIAASLRPKPPPIHFTM